jgi:hypothetical protein
MKKKVLLLTLIFSSVVMVNAQTTDVTNKNGVVVTPESGDWGIGFNAAPFLSYVGNMFNGNTNNSLSTAFVDANQAIYGKYFLSNSTAIRGSLRIMSYSAKNEILTDTNTINSTPDYVTDIMKSSGAGFVLSGGYEMRRGKNRLQGYYGGELMFQFGGTTPNVAYEYGAALDSTNIAMGGAVNGRVLSSKAGSTVGVGLRAFIGAEFFFLPKMSLAAEYGWGFMYNTTSAGETVTEYYGYENANATTQTTYEVTTVTGKSSGFLLDTDNLGGSLRLMYHF